MKQQTIKAQADKVTKATVRFTLGDEGAVRGSVYVEKSALNLPEDTAELPEGGLAIKVQVNAA